MDVKEAKIIQKMHLPVNIIKTVKQDWIDETKEYYIRQVISSWNPIDKINDVSVTLFSEGRTAYTVPLSDIKVVDNPRVIKSLEIIKQSNQVDIEKRYINGLLDKYGNKKCVLAYIGKLVDIVKQERKELGSDATKIAERKEIYEEIISYLNVATGTNYRATTNSYKYVIDARLNDGYSVDDFKKVIDNKKADWANSDMFKYMRPETLFGSRFESYLNQKGIKPADKNKIAGQPSYDIDAIQKRAELCTDFGL